MLALSTVMPSMAQQPTDSGDYNVSIMVVGDYKPVLERTFKINVAPQIVDTATSLQHDFNYNITPRRLTSVFQPSRIKAAKIIGEPTTRLYNNYIRFGLGNYWSGLLDAYYNSTRSTNLTYGAYLHHNSSWGTIGKTDDGTPYSPLYFGRASESETEVTLFGKYITKNELQLSSALSYNHDYNLAYGFSDSTLNAAMAVSRDDIKRSDYSMYRNRLTFTAGVKTLNTDVKKFGYDANVETHGLWGKWGHSEWMLRLNATAHYGFPMFDKYKGIVYLHLFADHFSQGLSAPEAFPLAFQAPIQPSTDTVRLNRGLQGVHPYIDFLFNGMQIHAGLKLVRDNYSNPKEFYGAIIPIEPEHAKFVFLPDITLSKNLMNEQLNLSAGFVGNINPVSYAAVWQYNPYALFVMPDLLQTTTDYDIFGAVRMNFSKQLMLKLHADYASRKNDLTFVRDYSVLGNVYRPALRDLDRLRAGGSFSFLNDELINIELGANYYLYTNVDTLPQLSKKAYLPSFDAFVSTHLNYKNKVLAHIQAMLIGSVGSDGYAEGVSVPAGAFVSEQLPMRGMLNLEVEYIHSRALSFFLKADNLIAQRYYYWAGYPSKRLNVMLGFTYTIPTHRQ